MDTRVVASGKVTVQDSEQGICYRSKSSRCLRRCLPLTEHQLRRLAAYRAQLLLVWRPGPIFSCILIVIVIPPVVVGPIRRSNTLRFFPCALDCPSAAAHLLPQITTKGLIVHINNNLFQRRDSLEARVYQRQRGSGPRTVERINGGLHCKDRPET